MENQQLIIIKSVMKPRNYSTLRAILKEEQGEKITPYIFKLGNASHVCDYLKQEKINFEIYRQEKLIAKKKPSNKKNIDQVIKRLEKAAIKY